MNSSTDRDLLNNAAESYGVPLPRYLTDARSLLNAATAYKTEVAALEEPDLATVTAKTIGKTIDAVLGFAQHGERLRLACRVEDIAASALDFAFMRFRQILMTELAAPFDTAAAAFMRDYENAAQQDPAVVATLADLVRVRDLLAGRVGEGLPATNLDEPTRIATFACRHDVINRAKLRTAGMDRGSQPYLEALLSIPGCRLRWQTPDQQRAHVTNMPAGGGGLAVTTTRGDVA